MMQIRKTRLAHINVFSEDGSTGTLSAAIMRRAQRQGFDVYMLYARGASTFDNACKLTNEFLCHATNWIEQRLGISGMLGILPTIRAIKYLTRVEPDIVHLHNIHGAYFCFPLFLRWAKSKRIPIVWTLHDCWPFTGGCAHYAMFDCVKWMHGCSKCQNFKRFYPHSLFSVASAVLAVKQRAINALPMVQLVAVSPWLEGEVRKSALSYIPITMIGNGVDTAVFKPIECGPLRRELLCDDAVLVLGVSGMWSEQKGFSAFMRLSGMLPKGYRIILVGTLRERPEIMPANVKIVDAVNEPANLAAYYAAADVYVNLSSQETFGLTTAEAQACGTPVIVYNSTGCAECIGEGCGVTVQKDDISAVCDAIISIIKAEKSIFSANCRKYAMENLSENGMVNKYMSVYHQAIEGKAADDQRA